VYEYVKLQWNVSGELASSPGALFSPTTAATSASAVVTVASPAQQKVETGSPGPGTICQPAFPATQVSPHVTLS
jgi:hypothetical protein